MKKKIQQKVTVEIAVCNICEKQIGKEPWSGSGAAKRLTMIRGLLKLGDFDAHETCINGVIREAVKKYL